MESRKEVINVNGISVPGITRDGVFISEQPINTFMLFKSGAFAAGVAKSFLVDFPIIPKTIVFSDTTNNNTYTLSILTYELVLWTMTIPVAQLKSYGTTKVLDFPLLVVDKLSRFSISATNAFQSVAIFANLAYNIDVRDF